MKPPAFQFYPDDFLGGTSNFTDSEKGLYIHLLCIQWSIGSLPDDDEELQSYGKPLGSQVTPIHRVKAKFEKCSDGRLRNKRMEEERSKQAAFRLSRSVNGSKGGRPQKASDNLVVLKTKATESSPSPSPSPSPFTITPPNPLKGVGESSINDPLDIPKELHSPEFTTAWQQWMTVRRGMGKKPKDWGVMFGEQLKWLKEYGVTEAVEILKQSIRNNYQGLFERNKKNATHNPSNTKSFDRNAGTCNEGRADLYRDVGKLLPVQNTQRSQAGSNGNGSGPV